MNTINIKGGRKMSIALNFLKAERIGARALRNRLSDFLQGNDPLVITEHGKPVRIMLNYEDILEILDIVDELSDPETIETVRKGKKAIAAGTNGIPAIDLIKKYKKQK